MKKLISLFLIFTLCFGILAGCGKRPDDKEAFSSDAADTQSVSEKDSDSAKAETDGENAEAQGDSESETDAQSSPSDSEGSSSKGSDASGTSPSGSTEGTSEGTAASSSGKKDGAGGKQNGAGTSSGGKNKPASDGKNTDVTETDEVEEIVGKMTIDEKIGQVILMDFRTWGVSSEGEKNRDMETDRTHDVQAALTELNGEVASIIADYHLGNVILFAENCQDTGSLAKLTYDMQRASLDAGGLPLLIGTDQEGGNVSRLATGCAFSGCMALGASGNTENAALAGKVMGSELAAVGINCDFAPDADVNTNINNPVIGMRSFSSDPDLVYKMAGAMSKALKNEGVIPCAKHFPGHGNTDTDSHTGLPLVDESYDTWLKTDGLPFKKLAADGIPMIMTAHIQYPGLDSTTAVSKSSGEKIYLPATLSKHILTDILKGELGYGGVIVTDAMNMDAIADNFGKEEAVIRALNAGADMLCMPVTVRRAEDRSKLDELYSAIKTAVKNGTLSEARLNDAVSRVIKMKLDCGIIGADYSKNVSAYVKNAEATVGSRAHRDIERKVADACVKVEYTAAFEKFNPAKTEKTVVLMPYTNEIASVKHAFARMTKEKGRTYDVTYFCYQKMTSVSDEMKASIADADYVIIGAEDTASTMNNASHWCNVMPKSLLSLASGKKCAVILEGLPYASAKYNTTCPCIVIYNYSGMSDADVGKETYSAKYGPAIPAAIEFIFK